MVSSNLDVDEQENSTADDNYDTRINGNKNAHKSAPMLKKKQSANANGISSHCDRNGYCEETLGLDEDSLNPPTPASQGSSCDNGNFSEDESSDNDSQEIPPIDHKLESALMPSNIDSLLINGRPEPRKPLHPTRFTSSSQVTEKGIIKNEYYTSISQNFNCVKGKIIESCQEHPIGLAIAVAVVIVACVILYPNEISSTSEHTKVKEEILNQYRAQDKKDLIHLFRIIDKVNQGKRETDKVAVITILYSDRETAECLAKDTANYALNVLNRNKYKYLNGSLSNSDFSLGNKYFKEDLENKGVLVVYDFHNFPAEKVRHFHGLCDKYTPYIDDKAVYLILLEMSKNQEVVTNKFEKLKSRIEELWSSLKSEVLEPLSVRLMDNVMVVQKELEPLLRC